MAEEKSIGTILGELYLEYIKTTNAASMSRVGAPNMAARPIGDEQTALIDFFNSFEPSTPEERQAKAIALEQIRNNNNPFFGLAKDFRDDFKTAAEIKAEEEDIIIEDVVAPDPLIADFVESETRDERIQATEGR